MRKYINDSAVQDSLQFIQEQKPQEQPKKNSHASLNPTSILNKVAEGNWGELIELVRERGDAKSEEDKEEYGVALFYATIANQYEAVEALLESGALLNGVREDERGRQTCVDVAVENNNPNMIRLFIKSGVEPVALPGRNVRETSFQQPPMVAAANKGYWDCVKAIAENYSYVQGRRTGYTQALNIAVHEDQPDIVALLTRQGADITGKSVFAGDSSDHPAALQAAEKGRWKCVIAMAENYRYRDVRDDTGFSSALLLAARNNCIDPMPALLQRGATDYIGCDNKKALHFAVIHNNAEMVKLLRSFGADPTERLGKCFSALDLAVEAENHRLINLLTIPSPPNIPDSLGHLIEGMKKLGPFTPERLDNLLKENIEQKSEEKNEAIKDAIIEPYGITKEDISWVFIQHYIACVEKFIAEYKNATLTRFKRLINPFSEQLQTLIQDLENILIKTEKGSSNPATIKSLQNRTDQFVNESSQNKKRKNGKEIQLLKKHNLFNQPGQTPMGPSAPLPEIRPNMNNSFMDSSSFPAQFPAGQTPMNSSAPPQESKPDINNLAVDANNFFLNNESSLNLTEQDNKQPPCNHEVSSSLINASSFFANNKVISVEEEESIWDASKKEQPASESNPISLDDDPPPYVESTEDIEYIETLPPPYSGLTI